MFQLAQELGKAIKMVGHQPSQSNGGPSIQPDDMHIVLWTSLKKDRS